MLTQAQSDHWHAHGFVVLPGFKAAAETAAALAHAHALVGAFEPTPETGVFSATDRSERSSGASAALLASAEQVHFFFEEEAFDAEGRLRVPKAESINKIGHALHELDPVFGPYSRGPALAELARDLFLKEPHPNQMAFSVHAARHARLGRE